MLVDGAAERRVGAELTDGLSPPPLSVEGEPVELSHGGDVWGPACQLLEDAPRLAVAITGVRFARLGQTARELPTEPATDGTGEVVPNGLGKAGRLCFGCPDCLRATQLALTGDEPSVRRGRSSDLSDDLLLGVASQERLGCLPGGCPSGVSPRVPGRGSAVGAGWSSCPGARRVVSPGPGVRREDGGAATGDLSPARRLRARSSAR